MLWMLHAENHGQAGVPSASSAPSGQGRGESIQPCVAAWQVTSMASAFVIDLAVQDFKNAQMLILTVMKLPFNSSIS